jgi:hypothetical protein
MSIAETEFVFVGGHFLARDENVFTLFEGHVPTAAGGAAAAQPQVRPRCAAGAPAPCLRCRVCMRLSCLSWGLY